MDKLQFFNNLSDCVCAFDFNNQIVFKNNAFINTFSNFKSFERFKKHFNFNICYLSTENLKNLTPFDMLLNSKENFQTICTHQNLEEEYTTYSLNKFMLGEYKVVILKNISAVFSLVDIEKQLQKLKKEYENVKSSNEKFLKIQEQSQSQFLKMGIINRIAMVIRETNDISTILHSALNEINNLLGSYKTYFSMKVKGGFKIKYYVNNSAPDFDIITEYEDDVIEQIKNKKIVVSVCRKEYINSDIFLPKGVKRLIIPVFNKNKLLGIIVSLTNQKFQIKDNEEILESISVHLASSIIQAGLIQQLNKKNTKLEKTLIELKETQIQLINTEKMASVGQLVSGVAHEINTPLASINSNTSLISKILNSEKNIDSNKIDILKDLNSIDIEAVQRISNIVKSLKRFVRLDEAQFQEADINKEIDLTLKLIQHELKDNIKIEKNYGPLTPVFCSVNMLNQVFMNLLVNACHSNANIITISTSTDDTNLTVKIKDNGEGIPSNVQNKIFDVGFTTKKIGLGTGLGLPISKKIIELHKGTLSFISKQNEGTEFTIIIPLKPKE